MEAQNASPLVSVILCFYNEEQFIHEAVKSVLDQTFQNWEKLREHGAQVIYPSHGDPFAAEELVAAG